MSEFMGDQFLLGDTAFNPPRKWLQCGYKKTGGALTPQEFEFNFCLSSCRMVIEMAFGILKVRWRSLFKKLEVDLTNAVPYISAAIVLHNLCIERHEEFDAAWIAEAKTLLSHETEAAEAAIAEARLGHSVARQKDAARTN